MAKWVSYLTFELTTWWLDKLCLSCDSIPTYVMHNERSREVNPEYTHCNPPELWSKGKYIRQYPYIVGLFKIWITMVHAHAMDTKASFSFPPLPSPQGLGTRLNFAELTHIFFIYWLLVLHLAKQCAVISLTLYFRIDFSWFMLLKDPLRE